jgi:hypothetical protein
MGMVPPPLPFRRKREEAQPKDEPLWIGYPEMAPIEAEDNPPQGGSAIAPVGLGGSVPDPYGFPVKYRSPVVPRVDRRLIGKEYW